MAPGADEPLDLLLVRHGETENNRIGRCQGWTDTPLNATGRAQAATVAQHLANTPIRHIVASPLLRAHETAKAIAAQHKAPIQLDKDLRELYHGTLEGIPFAELDNHVPGILQAWRTKPHEVSMPGGETLADLQARAWRAFVTHTEAQEPEEPTTHALVAHALTIGTILCKIDNVGLDKMWRYRLLPCGYWHVRREQGSWRALSVNRPMPE